MYIFYFFNAILFQFEMFTFWIVCFKSFHFSYVQCLVFLCRCNANISRIVINKVLLHIWSSLLFVFLPQSEEPDMCPVIVAEMKLLDWCQTGWWSAVPPSCFYSSIISISVFLKEDYKEMFCTALQHCISSHLWEQSGAGMSPNPQRKVSIWPLPVRRQWFSECDFGY